MFAGNLNTVGAVELTGPDGLRLRGGPLCLLYTDAASGDSVIIGSIKDSPGAVVPPASAYYQDAFDGDFVADALFTYTRGGLSQDILIVTAPPPPEQFGLPSATTRLEVLTEFAEAPEAQVRVEILKSQPDPQARALMAQPDLLDTSLDFGFFKMVNGQTFGMPAGEPERGIATGKSWVLVNGRRLLAESVDYPDIRPHLEGLPQAAAARPRPRLKDKGRWLAGAMPARPAGPAQPWRERRLASLDPDRRALRIDWVTLVGSHTNQVFSGIETYLIDGTVQLFGRATIEGGAAILFNQGGTTNQLVFNGPVDCLTSQWHPATFTAKDDRMFGITSNEPSGYYAQYALYCWRVSKKVYDWNTNTLSYDLAGERKFVHDGWNVVAELDGQNNMIRSYLWGIDLSGSLQGAGGVGGLLMVADVANGAHFVAYDGNGNVRGLADASDGADSANYDYDPFGRTLRATGAMALGNPCKFSTKYQDDETGLYYYGHRYLETDRARWPNRDPIDDWASLIHYFQKERRPVIDVNLYRFVLNQPISFVDELGLTWRTGNEIWKGVDNTIVCDGDGGINVALNENAKQGCAPAVFCTIVHENSHKQDILTENPDICKGKPHGTRIFTYDTQQRNASELKAFDAEFACLRRRACLFQKLCGTSVEDHINELKKERRKYE